MTDCPDLESSKNLEEEEKSAFPPSEELDKEITGTAYSNAIDKLETDNGENPNMSSTTIPLIEELRVEDEIKDNVNPPYAKITELHPCVRVAGVIIIIFLFLLLILVVYFANKSTACNQVVCMNLTVSGQVAPREYISGIDLDFWNTDAEVTLPPGNFSLNKVNYLGHGHTITVFICLQGPHNYSISCSAKGRLDCHSIPEDNHAKQSLFVGAKDSWTKYYIDIKCVNKTSGLKWT